MQKYRVVEPGEKRDPKKNYRVDITDGTLYEVRFEDACANIQKRQERVIEAPEDEDILVVSEVVMEQEGEKPDPLGR